MTRLLVLLLIVFNPAALYSQISEYFNPLVIQTDTVKDYEVFNLVNVENKPIFPGCEDLATEDERFNCFNIKIRQFVGKEFEFPEMAKQMGIQGKVWVSFIIEKDGKVSDIFIERGRDKLLDDEAIRVVRNLPRFTPAKIGGSPVRMRYSLPINAKLQ